MDFLSLFFGIEVLLGVLRDIDFLFKFKEIIQLNSDHPVQIEFKALKSHNHISWQCLQTSAL